MAHAPNGKKPIGKTVAYGLVTVALYAAVFSYADPLTAMFSQGSFWAAGPIATVFLFSWVHGAFAHNLWSSLGIEASRKTTTARATQPAARPQPRATLNA